MHGDDRVRFCGQCQLNVYNLSALSRAEAEQLITEKEGRLCISYYQRADGTVLTQDCPVGWRMAKKAAGRAVAVAAAVLVALLHVAMALGRSDRHRGGDSLKSAQPFRWVQARFAPPPAPIGGKLMIVGERCALPTTSNR
jgi:hypothetical protein